MSLKESYDLSALQDLLPLYYKHLFPYGPYYKWLCYGSVPKQYFSQREFSFTLKDDIYIRYQSFADHQELEKEIQKCCPYKIDIGAVFSHRIKLSQSKSEEDVTLPKIMNSLFIPNESSDEDERAPKDHKMVKANAFQALEKELVFDIDMTDYDDVRYCCSGAEICNKCWPLMVMAVKILDSALRDDFGFAHLLWVYSGRRGMHCWVCDETARKLSQNGRSAVAEYLCVVRGGENQMKKVTLDGSIHPSISRAIEAIDDYFLEYAVGYQDFLGDEARFTKFLSLIPDKKLQDIIVDSLETDMDSSERWKKLLHIVKEAKKDEELKKSHKVLEEIKLQFCYPRLDINVSKGINHLLKSPFCIHPKTGKVCIPVDPKTIDTFNPFEVPTIGQLIEELNNAEKEDKKRIKNYKKTALCKSMEVFDNFLKKLERSWAGKLQEQSDKTRDF